MTWGLEWVGLGCRAYQLGEGFPYDQVREVNVKDFRTLRNQIIMGGGETVG